MPFFMIFPRFYCFVALQVNLANTFVYMHISGRITLSCLVIEFLAIGCVQHKKASSLLLANMRNSKPHTTF